MTSAQDGPLSVVFFDRKHDRVAVIRHAEMLVE